MSKEKFWKFMFYPLSSLKRESTDAVIGHKCSIKGLQNIIYQSSLKDEDVIELLKMSVLATNCELATTTYINPITCSFQCVISKTLNYFKKYDLMSLEKYIFALNVNDQCQVVISPEMYEKLCKIYVKFNCIKVANIN